MSDPHKRLKRLQRLERIRSIAKQNAASGVSEAEATLARLSGLSDKTSRLAAEYAGRRMASDGAELQTLTRFTGALEQLSTSAIGDTDRAREIADARQVALAVAERRRAAVEQRITRQSQDIAKARTVHSLGARRPVGTSLE